MNQALETGLSADQRAAITAARAALEEITCTTIHGFCQQLIKPYPIEAGIDPGATIIDPAAADLAYQDLMTAWLSARFGRARGDDGLGRIPAMTGSVAKTISLPSFSPSRRTRLSPLLAPPPILRIKRTARAPHAELDTSILRRLSEDIRDFADWYAGCGIAEPATAECIADLTPIPVGARRRPQRSHHRARYCPPVAACAARLLPQQGTTL